MKTISILKIHWSIKLKPIIDIKSIFFSKVITKKFKTKKWGKVFIFVD